MKILKLSTLKFCMLYVNANPLLRKKGIELNSPFVTQVLSFSAKDLVILETALQLSILNSFEKMTQSCTEEKKGLDFSP